MASSDRLIILSSLSSKAEQPQGPPNDEIPIRAVTKDDESTVQEHEHCTALQSQQPGATEQLPQSVEHAPGPRQQDAPYCILPERQKIFLILTAAFAGIIPSLSSTTYYPAIPEIASNLHVSVSLINLTISTFLIMQGIAPSFIAPISESYGRRPALLLCLVLYVGANIGLALQSDYAALMVLRSLQSAGSSGTSSLSTAVVADLSTRAERGKYIGYAR